MARHTETKRRLKAEKIHRALCPICRHDNVAIIEKLYADFWFPIELTDRFQLVGPGRPYQHESSACRGLKRHMTRRGVHSKRKSHLRGAIRAGLRHGDRFGQFFRFVDPETTFEIFSRSFSKIMEDAHLRGESGSL